MRFSNSMDDVIMLCSHVPFYQDIHPWVFEKKYNELFINIEKFNKYELIAFGCFIHNMKFYCSKTNKVVIIHYDNKQIKISFADSFYDEQLYTAEKTILTRYTDNDPFTRMLLTPANKEYLMSLKYNFNMHMVGDKRDLIAKQMREFVIKLQKQHKPISQELLRKYLRITQLGFFEKYFQYNYIANYIYDLYQNCGGAVIFTGNAKCSKDWVLLGEDIQRFWLHANDIHMSLQPEYIDLLISTKTEYHTLKKNLHLFHMNLWPFFNEKTTASQTDILFMARLGYQKKKISLRKYPKEQHLILLK